MHQLTVRGLDNELAARLRETARGRGTSMNKAALWLMRRGAGLEEPRPDADVIGTTLDALRGSMTDDEAKLILEAVAEFERVDVEMWG